VTPLSPLRRASTTAWPSAWVGTCIPGATAATASWASTTALPTSPPPPATSTRA